jgi:very-short-patch-repair endonuclease
MQAVEALTRLGGTGGARALLRLTSRRSVRRAVARGEILRPARGRYALPTASEARRAAARLTGVVCLRSAVAAHGWELAFQPERPDVAVPRGRRVPPEVRDELHVVWMNLAEDDIASGVTTPLRTVVDCARRLSFTEALAVADAALRSGDVTPEELAALNVRGAGAAAVRRVLRNADARAANPFESVLRALCIEAGLDVEPQAELDLGTGVVHPDLVCHRLRVVVEADSWTFHSGRRAHRRDCARYNLLVVNGWAVLRFTWEQVMHQPGYVRWVLHQLLGRVGRPEVQGDARCPA